MIIREIRGGELNELLRLYTHLHESGVPDDSKRLRTVWDGILKDKNHHIIVCEVGGKIVSSCVCVIVPNLTRDLRPYALIENVVTHTDHRGRGFASACLDHAEKIAAEAGCYKIMLLTGAKDPAVLRFYSKAGFNSDDKTAFVKWL